MKTGSPSSLEPDAWRQADGWLLLISAIGLCTVTLLLVTDTGRLSSSAERENAMAKLKLASGSVRRRPSGTLAWEDVRTGARLYERDAMFVAPGGSATVAFDAGGTFDVEERSLVVLESAPQEATGAVRLSLVQGEVSGTVGAVPLAVQGASKLVMLKPGAAGRLARKRNEEPTLELWTGSATVGDIDVEPPVLPVRLEAPDPNQHVYFTRKGTAVSLLWDGQSAGGFILQVARDREFTRLVATAAAESGHHSFVAMSPGAYYWRVADAYGIPTSEVRKLTLVENSPPFPYLPLPDEVVLAPPGKAVPFWWTPVDGASHYLLEISPDSSFEKVVLTAEAVGPSFWAQLYWPEGQYHWRVRVHDPERGESPFSEPSSFRLVVKPVPDAPELLDPSIEVERAKTR